MANQERGDFRLTVGDRTLVLRLTTNALAEVEELAGMPCTVIVAQVEAGSVKALRYLLWATLRQHHPDIATEDKRSLAAIGDLIDEAGGLTGVRDQVAAFMRANQNPDAPPEDLADPPPAGTGGAAAARPAGIGAASTPTPSRSA